MLEDRAALQLVQQLQAFERSLRLPSCQLPRLPAPGLHADLAQDLFMRLVLNTLREQGGARHAFEVRHPSWLVEETFRLLREAAVALCYSD